MLITSICLILIKFWISVRYKEIIVTKCLMTFHFSQIQKQNSPILSFFLQTFFNFSSHFSIEIIIVWHCPCLHFHLQVKVCICFHQIVAKVSRSCCCWIKHTSMAIEGFNNLEHNWATTRVLITFYIIIGYLFMPLELQKHQNQELLHHKVRSRISWFLKSTCGIGRSFDIE